LGNFNFGSPPTSVSGRVVPFAGASEDWYTINFPLSGTRGTTNQGNPQIRLASGSNFVLDVYSMCGAAPSCGSGTNTAISQYGFIDNQSTAGVNQWTSHTTSWPSTIVFRVRRTSPPTTCAQGAYTVTISR